MRDGVAPSYAWLPHGSWDTLGEYLAIRFPMVSEKHWRARMGRGEVCNELGVRLSYDDRYLGGQRIFYYRERNNEPSIPFDEIILHQDNELIVVDKPHFVPVTPGGQYLHQSLLVRLRRQTGMRTITPIHRLDRDTAGVMLFSVNPDTRSQWQALFRLKQVHKVYEALAPVRSGLSFPRRVATRIVRDEQFFRVKDVPGEPNAFTLIELIAHNAAVGHYKLTPETGKMHQLRLHMSGLGIPILNDRFYPVALPQAEADFSAPLKLLARSISFTDPIRGVYHRFESARSL